MSEDLISRICSSVGLPRASLIRISDSAHRRYKIYKIPKRANGQFRIVAQPAREVKAIQRSIVDILRPVLPVHSCATAYEPGSSIGKNARIHSGCSYLLKFDFKGFFPSIGAESISLHFKKYLRDELTDSEIRFILKSCMWRATDDVPFGLCIGAPSSPFLANTVMFDFDEQVSTICEKLGVFYSRYSDDLTFSAKETIVLGEVERSVRDLLREIQYPRLVFNEDKRVSVGRGVSMRVTGLTLTNDGAVSVGRERKRGVRSGVHRFSAGSLNADQIDILRGELSFLLDIEPDFLRVLVQTYGIGVMRRLLPRKQQQGSE